MNKTKEVLAEELAVMTNRANSLQEQLDAKEDTREFEVIVQRIDETNKYLLVIPSKNFSAQLIRRDRNTLISTKDFVHSAEETKSNEAVAVPVISK